MANVRTLPRWAAVVAVCLGGVGLASTLFDHPFSATIMGWQHFIQVISAGLLGIGATGLFSISVLHRRHLNALIEMGNAHDDFWIVQASGALCVSGGGRISVVPEFNAMPDDDSDQVDLEDGTSFRLIRFPQTHGLKLTVADDLTESLKQQRKTEAALLESQELARVSADWAWRLDAEHNFVDVSPLYTPDIGHTRANLIGRRLIEVLDVRRSPTDIRNLMSFIHDQEAFSGVIVPMRLQSGQDNHWLQLSARPSIDDAGRFNGYTGVARDVTEPHKLMLENASETRALRDAIEAVSEGLAIFNADGQFQMCNRRLANDFASMAHLLQGTSTLEGLFNGLIRAGHLALPDDAPSEATSALVRELERAQMRREFKGKNNRWFFSTITRSADDSIVVVLSDITRHKDHEAELGGKIDELEVTKTELVGQKETLARLAENLAQARNQADSANRAKSEFLAAMSHELRTPLNAIIGFSEVMVSESLGELGNNKYREYSRDIHGSGRHLLHIINNILDLSKADAGKLELKLQPISLTDLIESSARAATPDSDHADLIIDVAPDVEEIVADPQKLKQIMVNLISNAMKFTPDNGRVVVSAERLQDRTRITVRDNGIGMRREDIPKALAAFRQIDSSLGRKFEGTGLGLPLALRFAQLHDGDLSIDSEEGEGTTITVTLPDNLPKAAVA